MLEIFVCFSVSLSLCLFVCLTVDLSIEVMTILPIKGETIFNASAIRLRALYQVEVDIEETARVRRSVLADEVLIEVENEETADWVANLRLRMEEPAD